MKAQRGFVALLMIVLIAVGVFGVMAAWVASDPPPSKQAINRVVLRQAKEALLAYVVETALSSKNTRLPCPNITGDGKADVDPIPGGTAKPCGLAGNTQLGLLPWNALSLPPLRDAYGECLWYAVDGQFKNAPASETTTGVNADTDGGITIKDEAGHILADKVVAVVFARSAQTGLQSHGTSTSGAPPCATSPTEDAAQDAAGYLGSSNAAPATNAITLVNFSSATELAPDKASLTHQLIWITAEEFAAVAMRANSEALKTALNSLSSTTKGRLPLAANTPGGGCMAGQYSGFFPLYCHYPDPDPGAPVGSMLSFDLSGPLKTDEWHKLAFYAVAPGCAFDMPVATTASTCLPGTLLSAASLPVSGVILARGRALSGQDCSKTLLFDAVLKLECIEAGVNGTDNGIELVTNPKVSTQTRKLITPDKQPQSNDVLKELK